MTNTELYILLPILALMLVAFIIVQVGKYRPNNRVVSKFTKPISSKQNKEKNLTFSYFTILIFFFVIWLISIYLLGIENGSKITAVLFIGGVFSSFIRKFVYKDTAKFKVFDEKKNKSHYD